MINDYVENTDNTEKIAVEYLPENQDLYDSTMEYLNNPFTTTAGGAAIGADMGYRLGRTPGAIIGGLGGSTLGYLASRAMNGKPINWARAGEEFSSNPVNTAVLGGIVGHGLGNAMNSRSTIPRILGTGVGALLGYNAGHEARKATNEVFNDMYNHPENYKDYISQEDLRAELDAKLR